MKRIISIILSALLVFSANCIFSVAADNEAGEYTKLIYDYEGGKSGKAWNIGGSASEFWYNDMTVNYGLSGVWQRVNGSGCAIRIPFSPGDWHDDYYGEPIAFAFDVYGVGSKDVTIDKLGLTYRGNGLDWFYIKDSLDQPESAKCIPAQTVTNIRVDVTSNIDWSKYSTDSTVAGKNIFFGFTAKNSNSDVLIDNFSAVYKIPQENFETDGQITDALSTKAEASIRLNSKCGIRFYTSFDATKIDGTVVEKGTLIGIKDKIGAYLTIEDTVTESGVSPKAVAVPYTSKTLWENNEFVGSIVSIKPENYAKEFFARAYVKLDDNTYFYSATTTTKTVAEIADSFISEDRDIYDELDDTTRELVDTWAKAND